MQPSSVALDEPCLRPIIRFERSLLTPRPALGKPFRMPLHVSADIQLSEPTVDCGLVTWFHIDILDDDRDDGSEPIRAGHTRVVRIRASHAADNYESLWETIFAGSGELEAIYEIFYHDRGLKKNFSDGSSADVLYVSEIDLEPAYEHRNIDLALLRRLCDTICHGSALAVVDYTSQHDIAHWERLGFEVATPGADEGYLFLRLTHRTARIDDPDKPVHFKVLPNASPEDPHSQN